MKRFFLSMASLSPQLGIIGLGTMGSNFAQNLLRHDIGVAVYNRTTSVTHSFVEAHPAATAAQDLTALVASLPHPRIILLMVPAGAPTDSVLSDLLPLLAAEDIIIDGGNAHVRHTQERQQRAQEYQVHYVGMGISGGAEGARLGPSLMPGGNPALWSLLSPLLAPLAARDFAGNPCVSWMGAGASGHYVKMVHNGIEYAMMDALASLYQLHRDSYQMDVLALAEVFASLHTPLLDSFLLDCVQDVLHKKEGDAYLVDLIRDTAGQKGTGLWTTQEALHESVPVTTTSAAVFARMMSSQQARRAHLHTLTSSSTPSPTPLSSATLSQALTAAFLIMFSQGFELLQHASTTYQWNISLGEVARIWQGGCIIRIGLLAPLQEACVTLETSHILLDHPMIQAQLQKTLPALRTVVLEVVSQHIPMPSLSAALTYVDTMSHERGAANMIQGLRDRFGNHGYERIDTDGIFHSDWS